VVNYFGEPNTNKRKKMKYFKHFAALIILISLSISALGNPLKVKGFYVGQDIDEACKLLQNLVDGKVENKWLDVMNGSTLMDIIVSGKIVPASAEIIKEYGIKLDQGCTIGGDSIGGSNGKVKIILLTSIKKIFKTKSSAEKFAQGFANGYKISEMETKSFDPGGISYEGWINEASGVFIQSSYTSESDYRTVNGTALVIFEKGSSGSFD
jgi:hypothetical protein